MADRQAKKLHPDRNPGSHGQATQVGPSCLVRISIVLIHVWDGIINSGLYSGVLKLCDFTTFLIEKLASRWDIRFGMFLLDTIDFQNVQSSGAFYHADILYLQEFAQLRADFEEAVKLMEQRRSSCLHQNKGACLVGKASPEIMV